LEGKKYNIYIFCFTRQIFWNHDWFVIVTNIHKFSSKLKNLSVESECVCSQACISLELTLFPPNEKWYLYNYFVTTFRQFSLLYSHYHFIISLPFSLSIVFNQWKEREKKFSPKVVSNGCSNITALS